MSDLVNLAAAVPLLPFAAFLVALFGGYFFDRALPKQGALPGIIAMAGSLVLSAWLALSVAGGNTANQAVWQWVPPVGATYGISFGVLLDPLSALMAVIVSTVALLVFVFSLGYMNDENEPGLPRYYAGLALFSASMLGFTLSSNLVESFVFFELVGFCSWWLIGHWFREPGPASAAKKAFLVTRFGDYFLLVGVVAVLGTFGTAAFAGGNSFPALAAAALTGGSGQVRTFLGLSAGQWFPVIGLLVLGGVIGKSSQFPLHTWLPDAMEGPTPVSALIHAATMVAAGVYLVARMYGFYALLPSVLAVIALVGAFTALFAATMGMVKREIKQVLAYSTISQYGYIMLGLGSGGYVAGLFHLLSHATFKALLFLGAGAVIVAMHHDEDMWNMGGLKDRMPVVYWAFLSGSLALAGIVPFAGFWSKDAVLYRALTVGMDGHPLILLAYLLGLVAVLFTGFYTFRMVVLTWYGEPRSSEAENASEASWNMRLPVAILGIGALVVGFLNVDTLSSYVPQSVLFLENWLAGPIATTSADHYASLVANVAGFHAAAFPALGSAAISLVFALAGAGLAVWLYTGEPVEHTDALGPAKTVLYNNYYQDEYQVWLAEGVAQPVARGLDRFDGAVVDGVVNAASSVSLFAAARVKRVQDGSASNYVAYAATGLVLVAVALGLLGGWF